MIDTLPLKDKDSERLVLIITGLSGAGKTSVMRSLEDLGFYCVDNLPLPLLATFLQLAFQKNSNFAKVALGIDARGEQFLSEFINEMQTIKGQQKDYSLKIIFISAHEQTLLKRFQETRRKHPFAGSLSIEQALDKEKRTMAPIMAMADVILETDALTIHDLRKLIRTRFSQGLQQELTVNIMSFGFKYGVPPESNLVYDLRFLPNPYFIPVLKAHDGRSAAVQDYLFSHESVQNYWKRFADFLQFVLSHYYEEGRFFVTVAIGCTGGKHRSVALAEKLSQQTWPNIKFLITHRDLGKE